MTLSTTLQFCVTWIAESELPVFWVTVLPFTVLPSETTIIFPTLPERMLLDNLEDLCPR